MCSSDLRRPHIYLFDDSFSALDTETDALVRARLAEVAAESTVIIVAQRISTILQADQVIVVDDGQVVGVGTHESLLVSCPTYAQFADSQSLGPTTSLQRSKGAGIGQSDLAGGKP